MAVISFGFTQVVAERNKHVKGNININTHLSLEDVNEQKLNLNNEKQKGLKISFKFNADYEPDLGRIVVGGEVTHIFDLETADKILKSWEANKTIPNDQISRIYSNILSKCHVEAIAISRDVGLPPPMPMPSVKPKKEDYIG